ncbi:hypothetical protein Bbelb_279770 [Branchiostoma belcheri]|nr:hypothetical protein Bbelb_279770 [Branchiostoma belcheri]
MTCRADCSVIPLLGGIIFVFCALAGCCTAVPTPWPPTGYGCVYDGKVYSPGETIYEQPGCMGHGAYCTDGGDIIQWDIFVFKCCEHDGDYYEGGETVTIGGVTCYCEGSDNEDPAPMICPETTTAPVMITISPTDSTNEEEEDEMQAWYDDFMELMSKMLAAVQKLKKCSTLPTF